LIGHGRVPTAVNVDGLEWHRAKWNRLGQRVFYEGARLCGRHADEIIYDSEALRPHWRTAFGVDRGVFIPYGADLVDDAPIDHIKRLGLYPGKYILVVSRLVQENSIDLFLDASRMLDGTLPLVLVGSGRPHDPLVRRLNNFAASRNLLLLGHVNDQQLLNALWQHSGAYWHGHSVGGTNPGLLQAMGAGAPTLALDTPFNSEVLRCADQLIPPDHKILAARLQELVNSPTLQETFRQSQRRTIISSYSWDSVCRAYEQVLTQLALHPVAKAIRTETAGPG
jgi:glycosyltransferase involved in cell wall biosynthesis